MIQKVFMCYAYMENDMREVSMGRVNKDESFEIQVFAAGHCCSGNTLSAAFFPHPDNPTALNRLCCPRDILDGNSIPEYIGMEGKPHFPEEKCGNCGAAWVS